MARTDNIVVDLPDQARSLRPFTPAQWTMVAITIALLLPAFYGELAAIWFIWNADDDWSHGFLVPLIAGFIIYRRIVQAEIRAFKPSPWGLFMVCSGLLLHVLIGYHSTNIFWRGMTIWVVVCGLYLTWCGLVIFRKTWPALVYGLLALPWPETFKLTISMPLRQYSAAAAAFVLSLIPGWSAEVSGVTIILQGLGKSAHLEVVQACSGFTYLMAIVSICAAIALLAAKPFWQRTALLCAAFPLAFMANILRLILMGIVCLIADVAYIEGHYHDAWGYSVLLIAFVGLMGFLIALGKAFPAQRSAVVEAVTAATSIKPASEALPGTAAFTNLPFFGLLLLCAYVPFRHWLNPNDALFQATYRTLVAETPIRKPYSELAVERLLPFDVLQKEAIPARSAGLLGAVDSLKLIVQEQSFFSHKSPRPFHSSLTYCLGEVARHEAMQHLPHKCLPFVGYRPFGSPRVLKVAFPGGTESGDEIPVLFTALEHGGSPNAPVLYTYAVSLFNGRFITTITEREEIMRADGNFKFYAQLGVVMEGKRDETDVCETLALRYLQLVLPVLIEEHWPIATAGSERLDRTERTTSRLIVLNTGG